MTKVLVTAQISFASTERDATYCGNSGRLQFWMSPQKNREEAEQMIYTLNKTSIFVLKNSLKS